MKIIILGGSILQVPLIKKAKQLSLEVVLIDFNPNAIGIKYADKFYEVSTNDTDRIETIFLEENAKCIITAATDSPMKSIAKINDKYNLIGINFETALNATNKALMRKKLQEHTVPIPNFIKVSNYNDFIEALKLFKGKKIVKPVDSSGSRGIFLLEDDKYNREAFYHAKKHSTNGDILIEEYLIGDEISVESIVIEGETHIIAVTDKMTTGKPHFIELGHSIPSKFEGEVLTSIYEVTKQANKALGISIGPSHTEIIITDSGPKIVEVGARLGGDFITSHLVPESTKVDLLKLHIMQSIGENISIENIESYGSTIRYFQSTEGLIKKLSSEKVKDNDNIVDLCFYVRVNDKVNKLTSSGSRIGHIIYKSESVEKAIKEVEEVMKQIEIEVE